MNYFLGIILLILLTPIRGFMVVLGFLYELSRYQICIGINDHKDIIKKIDEA